MGTGLIPRVKQQRDSVNHPISYSTEVKAREWLQLYPPQAPMACSRENFLSLPATPIFKRISLFVHISGSTA
jgi:hypothetical protein